MLILSRRHGESIKIGDEVTITILQSKGGQVKIGIDAPREIAVHREEVYQRISEQLPQACAPASSANTISQSAGEPENSAEEEIA